MTESSRDGGAWWAAVHGVAKSRTWVRDFTFTFHFHALEKAMATHSSVLAWRIPGTEEPSGLLSMGSHRVGHGWSDLAAAAQHPFLINYLSKLGIEGILFNLLKGVCKKIKANITLISERLNAFFLRWGRRKRCLLSTYLLSIIVEILANKIRKEIKGM